MFRKDKNDNECEVFKNALMNLMNTEKFEDIYYKNGSPNIDLELLDRTIDVATKQDIDITGFIIKCDNAKQCLTLENKREAIQLEKILYSKGYDELVLEDNKIYFNSDPYHFYMMSIYRNNLHIKCFNARYYLNIFKSKN